MENSTKKNWLYGVIALLVLALVIETGFLISKVGARPREKRFDWPSPRQPQGQFAPHSWTRQARKPAMSPTAWGDWDPFEEMRRMQEEMNQIFDEGFGRAMRSPVFSSPAGAFSQAFQFPAFSPAIDLSETEEAYIAKADLPGLEKEKIQASVSGNVLTIQGERHTGTEKEDAGKGFSSMERSYGSFARSVTLPGPVDEAGVTADYSNGVLTVTLPKLKGAPSSKKSIPVT